MNKSFTSSKQVFEWLSGFINLERGQKPKSFNLDRMKILTELADNPEKCAPSIHIAGSKGKGSVTGMLAVMLTAAGFKVARYMSPHVTDIRERICLGDQFFDDDVYCSAGDELRGIAEGNLPQIFDSKNPDGSEPTFWELLTLLFFLCTRKSKCDVMVVETGMGGRLDSTNVLDPLVSVITLIELEHTSFLGDTIAKIAGEKAGIIKDGKPLILAKQNSEALEVFKNKAQEKNSPLYYFPEIAELTNVNITPHCTEFHLALSSSSLRVLSASVPPCKPLLFSIPLPGKVQAENAALAITALKAAFPKIADETLRKGLANLKIPARFEKIAEQPLFIIDGAHTPESLALCIETFCSLYGKGGILLFGCAADKDEQTMAKIAHSFFSKIIITTPGNFKISNPQKVYEAFAAITGKEKTELILDTKEAVEKAILFAKTSHGGTETRSEDESEYLPIFGTGSFYLVSEIRKFVI
ncbi:MAG: bifunctional folylpolyglutamate synthase/dihydrofolate synthase [Treponema sp.]|nr:bifunctional folylpolyglutamate synthase/dihydrofolate synthase [Treponema sp.]